MATIATDKLTLMAYTLARPRKARNVKVWRVPHFSAKERKKGILTGM